MALYLLLPMDQVLFLLLLLPSTSVLPLPIFKLILCSSHVVAVVAAAPTAPTAANNDDDDDDDDDDYANEYDLTPDASFFVGFRNHFSSYHLIP